MDLPIEHGDFPVRYVNVYRRVYAPGLWFEWEHGEMEIQPEFWGSLMAFLTGYNYPTIWVITFVAEDPSIFMEVYGWELIIGPNVAPTGNSQMASHNVSCPWQSPRIQLFFLVARGWLLFYISWYAGIYSIGPGVYDNLP